MPSGRCNILEFYARKQAHVVRSTWGAELCQLSDSCDFLLLLGAFLAEVQLGAMSAKQLRDMVDGCEGALAPPIELHACVDAQSVFAGITAEAVRMPAERHTLYHAQWIRQLLDRGILSGLWWIDTRDMIADGLTKGAVEREALLKTMRGEWHCQHPAMLWCRGMKPNR